MSQEEAQRLEEEEAARAAEAAAATIPPAPNYHPPPPPSSKIQPDSVGGKSGIALNTPAGDRREATILPVVEEAAEGTSSGDRSRSSRVSSLLTESDGRPLTPVKDGREKEPGFANPILSSRTGSRSSNAPTYAPPTPPKTAHGYAGQPKSESADSGYGVGAGSSTGNSGPRSRSGSQKSLRLRPQISRDSLDKALPPLPNALSSRSPNMP